jgi:hypothetical protein
MTVVMSRCGGGGGGGGGSRRRCYYYPLAAAAALCGGALLLLFAGFFSWRKAGYAELRLSSSSYAHLTEPKRPVAADAPRGRGRGRGTFYLLNVPEITSWLIGNYTDEAAHYYDHSLNEEQAEVWLHRGFDHMTEQEGRTFNASEADVVIVPGYLHLNHHLVKTEQAKSGQGKVPYVNDDWTDLVSSRVIPGKLHLIAVPSWNPKRSNNVGIKSLVETLKVSGVPVTSLGFERNRYWQGGVSADRILPVPYVVNPTLSAEELSAKTTAATDNRRIENFVFYAGDGRPHAVDWAGCNRSVILPLQNRTDNMDVRLVTGGNRLTQEQYNVRMLTSDYCLILCGDTPTSRSLASSMLYGCIPIRVGSRLRGLCEPPCHAGFGWEATGISHLPFANQIDWSLFPEVDEAEFALDPGYVLDDLFLTTSAAVKRELRAIMKETQMAWTYGWGNPVDSTEFGQAVPYIWDSIVDHLVQTGVIKAEEDAGESTDS